MNEVKVYRADAEWDTAKLERLGISKAPEQLVKMVIEGQCLAFDIDILICKLDKAKTGTEIESLIIDNDIMERISEYKQNGCLNARLHNLNDYVSGSDDLTDDEKDWLIHFSNEAERYGDLLMEGYMKIVKAQTNAMLRLLHG